VGQLDHRLPKTRIEAVRERLKKVRRQTKSKFLLWAAFVLVCAIVVLFFSSGSRTDPNESYVFYEVVKSDLPISVTERGYLESQEQTTIECQVETYDRNSGNSGIAILFIVPNGSVVEEGQLLVELDSSSIRDRLESETLEFQSDKSTLLQAEARKKNQLTQNQTRIAEAKLAFELAKLDREMYVDEISGAFKLATEEIERQIDDTRNTILEAQAALKLQETEKAGIEELFRLGYKGKSDLDQSRFSFMKAEAALAAAVNRLSNHEASRRQLQTYEYKKELLRLDGAVATAENNLHQVEVTNESELAQVDAQLYESRERVKRQESRIKTLERQLSNCTIVAPHAGMVVYAFGDSRNEPIGEGVLVRQRQEILRLPDLTKMQVRTQIHEAVLDQVRRGQDVSVNVDAFPDRSFDGVVSEVAVVPSNNSNTNAKTYDCVVRIESEVSQLKPGMTAVTEVHIDRLSDVLSVPVQAIMQSDGEASCFVDVGSTVEKRAVELGRNNDMFVQLVSGVQPGDRVVLNPKSVFQESSSSRQTIRPDEGQTDPDSGQPDESEVVNRSQDVSEGESLVASEKQEKVKPKP
jgi:HlyD family secretion protein